MRALVNKLVVWKTFSIMALSFFMICFLFSSLTGSGIALLSKYWLEYKDQTLSQNIFICMLVILSCMVSSFMDNADLLSMNMSHCVSFCFVGFMYCYDLMFVNILKSADIPHHIIGWLGLFAMLFLDIGGGMTCRLLFDGLTSLIIQIQDKFCIDLNYFYWISFVVIRIEWYNFVLMRALYQSYKKEIYFQYFIIVWIAFANYYHYNLFKQGFLYNVTIKRWFLRHRFLTTCAVIIPFFVFMFAMI